MIREVRRCPGLGPLHPEALPNLVASRLSFLCVDLLAAGDAGGVELAGLLNGHGVHTSEVRDELHPALVFAVEHDLRDLMVPVLGFAQDVQEVAGKFRCSDEL